MPLKSWPKLKQKVAIIGLGYVGLPLAVAAANSNFLVSGVDADEMKVLGVNNGISTIEDIADLDLKKLVLDGVLTASTDFSVIKEVQIVLICVPTPLTPDQKPDLTYVKAATKSVASHLAEDTLVILESTVSPGTTRNLIAPMLAQFSGLKPSQIQVAFSPERIDPSNKTWGVKNTPKLVAGLSKEASTRAIDFYSSFIDEVIRCDSLEVAETAKLLENSFRYINISFINEFLIFCQKLGVDVNQVIKAAATKPYGFMPFYPSIGVGGHCIPVDPLYLSNKARELGAPTRFIDLAHQINQEMPGYFVGRAEEKLGGLRDKRILVVGVAYKPNVADVRETPVAALINGLKSKGAQVSWHDDLVSEWNNEISVELKVGYDLAILATPHAYIDLKKLGETLILDTRGLV
jgi:UDP-N-acetyl-D-glucosamine dehydrogenase